MEAFGSDMLQKLFSDFSCPRNLDVEIFLKSKARRFEESDSSRTYLILNEQGNILAYFSLTFKEISLVHSEISKSKIKRLDGMNKNAEKVKTYLIGQIGKNFSVKPNPISLSLILDEIYAIIGAAKALVGGRVIILECDKDSALINLYKANGFEELINTPSEKLVTMYTYIT